MISTIIWNGNNITEIAKFLGHEDFWHKNGDLYVQTGGCLLLFVKGQSFTKVKEIAIKQERDSAEFKSSLKKLLLEVSDMADIKETKLDEQLCEFDRDAWMLGRIIEASGLDIYFEWVKERK